MRGMDAVDQRIDLRDVLPMLTEKQARALGMWIDEGYTQKEVGIVMGIRQQCAGKLINRGLARIRWWLETG
ncbi:MAG TPA: hypothetical protein VM537_37285, partial [Anaerolineae bacterium]|nr:hypothetical protein [Anaerolineae bacterium]